MSDKPLICATCGKPIERGQNYMRLRRDFEPPEAAGPWHRLCIPPRENLAVSDPRPATPSDLLDAIRQANEFLKEKDAEIARLRLKLEAHGIQIDEAGET